MQPPPSIEGSDDVIGDGQHMRDALGSVQSVLVLGGNSEIALAIVDRLVASRCSRVVLGVRQPESAQRAIDHLRAAGAEAEAIAFDALEPATHTATIATAADLLGDIDMVILAFGVLGDQATFDADPVAAADAARANYVGAVSSGLAAAARMRAQGHGTIMVITSVAGVRTRADNFVYGSTKAGMDAFAQGLDDSLVGTGVRAVIVRPGFVHTRMTEGMKPAPFSATPDQIADAVMTGLQRGRRVIWAPPILRPVFTILRHLPLPLWRRLGG